MKTKRPLAEAHAIAKMLLVELGLLCERIEVAGSVRRGKAEVGVGDEVVIMPRLFKEAL